MRKFPYFIFFLLASLSYAEQISTVYIEETSLVRVQQFLTARPLPEGYETRAAKQQEVPGELLRGRIFLRDFLSWEISADNESLPEHSLMVEKIPYAPAVPLWDPREDIALENVGESSIPLLPLEQIVPPLRGLAVSGIYPDSGDYPLYRERRLYLESSDEVLLAWFSRLEEQMQTEVKASGRTDQKILWVAGTGDIMVGRGVEDALIWRKNGVEWIFRDVLPEMLQADLLLGNLEGAVTRKGTKHPVKTYTFRFRPEVLPRLKDAGFDYLSITNNHTFDYGMDGFIDTLRNLAEAGIPTSGVGMHLQEAEQAWQTVCKETPVRILSLADYPIERTGFNGRKETPAGPETAGMLWTGEEGYQAVRNMSSPDSFDIVMIHGGTEWWDRPSAAQKTTFRKVIDAGADLVIGSHPHYLQGTESYKGKLIVYSLGNFVFPGMQETAFGEDSLLISLGVYQGVIRYVRFIPVRIDGQRNSLDATGSILSRYLRLTRELHPEAGTE